MFCIEGNKILEFGVIMAIGVAAEGLFEFFYIGLLGVDLAHD